MKKVRKQNRMERVMHVVSIGILLISVLFSVFRFAPVLLRTWQAIKDLAISIAYYFTNIFQYYDVVTPTVNEIPSGALGVLPFDPYEFKEKMGEFGRALIAKESFAAFFRMWGNRFLKISEYLPFVLIVVLIFVLVGGIVYDKVTTERDVDTKPLKIWKKIEAATWDKAKAWLRRYKTFLCSRRKYVLAFCLIWIYNLNFATIAMEAVAYALYLVTSYDILHIYTQVAKLALDLTVAIDFLPTIVWIIVGWVIFDRIRQSLGMVRLRLYEEHNREFLKNHPGALFVVGKQRTGKTTMVVDMAMSQERLDREKALEKMLGRSKQFAYFPWINLEYAYKEGRVRGVLPTLESCRKFIRTLQFHFTNEKRYDKATRKAALRYLRKKYGYTFDDFIFQYDYKRYGLKYNDGLTMVSVFEAIEAYVQHYYIYSARRSLIFGNLPIRSDLRWTDYGNFPVYDGDFFDRAPEELDEISEYCHILDWNCLRLGKVTNPKDPYKDGFEAGIVVGMEHAKERGNQVSNVGVKADAKECNVRNDGFELNAKMQGHASTVDNYTYFRLLIDDQRPDSLGAENKDLCDIIKIVDKSEGKVVMPFFTLEGIVLAVANRFYDKRYLNDRVLHAGNSLLIYLLKKVFMPFFHYCERRANKFSVCTSKLKVWDGHTNEVVGEGDKYYISAKKTYSKRFATDGIKDFYSKKAAKSKVGLHDFPCFGDVRMTVEEMEWMQSHFYAKLMKVKAFEQDAA